MATDLNISSLSSDSPGYNTSFEDDFNYRYNYTGYLSNYMGYTLAESVVIGTVLSSFVILAIISNILVCVAVFTKRKLKTENNSFIVSWAIANLLMAVLVMSFAVINDITEKWYFGSVFCKVWISLDITCGTSCILNLCVITLDRYLQIRDPFKYDTFLTWKKVTVIISTVWIISIIVSFVPILLQWDKNPSQRSKPPQEDACFVGLNPAFAIFNASISFFIPCFLLLATYVQLYVYVRRQAANIKKTTTSAFLRNTGSSDKGNNSSNHKETIITLGVLIGVFLFCWTPIVTVSLKSLFCNCIPGIIFKILNWLYYVSSCLNPIVYSIFNKEMRIAVRHILCPKACPCAKSNGNGYSTNHKRGSTTPNKSDDIMQHNEKDNEQSCKEPLCLEMTAQ